MMPKPSNETNPQMAIREIVVVEGKDDVEAVKRAVACECIITHGHGFGDRLLDQLELLQERRGLIVFTDPDYAGKKIRARIRERIPEAKHAFLSRQRALRGDDIGVENASPEAIREALSRAHAEWAERRTEFSREELRSLGLEGGSGAKELRIRLCDLLGIGYANAKQLVARLNAFDISRDDFEEALRRARESAGAAGEKR